jgi:hypothetical protein
MDTAVPTATRARVAAISIFAIAHGPVLQLVNAMETQSRIVIVAFTRTYEAVAEVGRSPFRE